MAMGYCTPSRYKLTGERKTDLELEREEDREVQIWIAAENDRLKRRAERQRQREYYRKVGMMRRALGAIDDVFIDSIPVEIRVDKHDCQRELTNGSFCGS